MKIKPSRIKITNKCKQLLKCSRTNYKQIHFAQRADIDLKGEKTNSDNAVYEQ